MNDISAIRPKLRQDSIFLPTSQGVCFRNGNNTFNLKGKSIYKWVTTLAPHLDGRQTLEELCAPLAPERREIVVRLVTTLLEKGVVKNSFVEPAETLPAAVRARFVSQIDFIDHYAERPLQAFKDFRQSRVLLIGAGEAVKALASSLLGNGMESLHIALTGGTPDDLLELEAEAQSLSDAGAPASLSVTSADEAIISRNLDEFGLVACCCERSSLRLVSLLNEKCYREGIDFLPGFVFNGRSFIGPLVRAGQTGCWQCAVLRLSANMEAPAKAALWKSIALGGDSVSQEEHAASLPTARMLGNGMAFEIFKTLGGHLTPESAGGILIQDLLTLESSRPFLFGHPLCNVCSHVEPEAESRRLLEIAEGKRDQVVGSVDEPLRRFYQRMDAQLGLLHGFDDKDLRQLPLRTTVLLMGHPADAASGQLRIQGHSEETNLHAMNAAFATSLKVYAEALPDRRRMIVGSSQELESAGLNPVGASELSLWSGIAAPDYESRLEWLPAYSHLTGSIRYVPAAAVYPVSPLNDAGVFEKTSAGAAAGLTYGEAKTDGLMSAMCYESLRGVLRKQSEVSFVDAAALAVSDEMLAYLLKSLERLGHTARLFEVTSPSPVHVALAATDAGNDETGSIWRCGYKLGTGLTRTEALRKALVELLGSLQAGPQAGAMDAGESLFPGFNFQLSLESSTPQGASTRERDFSVEEIESSLKAQGRDILFVNTMTQDIDETETFITGRVLLTRLP